MSISSYSSLRGQTPSVTFAVTTGGFLSAGSLWFCVQALNRVGRNLLSTPVQLTWGANAAIAITISDRATGEEVYEYVISAAATNDPTAMRLLLSVRARNNLTVGSVVYPGQGTYKTLPLSVELTQDSQTAIAPSVATPDDLPTANLLHGMVRFITSTSEYVAYDDYSETWITDSLSLISTYLAATTDAGGCDRPLGELTPSDLKYQPPAYGGNGSDSYPVALWYSNGLAEESGAAEPQGTRLTLQLAANGRNITAAFSGRAYFKFLGYVRRSTGVLDTSIPGVGDTIVWTAEDSPIELPQDLPKGYAAAYELFFRFRNAELQSVLQRGVQITTLLYPEGLLGKPDSSWAIVGDVVLPDGDLMRILPVSGGVRRLPGKCLVGGYRSPSVGETELIGLPEEQPVIKITVSAALAGAIAYRLPADNVLTTEAVRAVVSTMGGITGSSMLTDAVTIADDTEAIRVTIDYPTAIRSDYPDRIAGQTAAFNAPLVRIYVIAAGIIHQLPDLTPTPPTQTIDITTLDDALVIDDLPIAPNPEFGLFGYEEIAAAVQSVSPATTDLVAGSYQVAIAYYYSTSNDRVTAISHSESDGCIPEFIALQDAIAQSSAILTGAVPPTSGQGTENDVFIEAAGVTINIYDKTSPETWTLRGTVTAPAGIDGTDGADGVNAYTMTTGDFIQPAIASTVEISVGSSEWMAIDQPVFVTDGGLYVVTAKGVGTFTAELLEPLITTPPEATIAFPADVAPAGLQGLPGDWTGALGGEGDPNGLILSRVQYDLYIDTIAPDGGRLWWSAAADSTSWTQFPVGSGGGGS